ncbi:MAG: leader peptidase (prepilin peptidase) / N-methyltransferase [Pseudonocardiales bacterium]|nr:leader peptidase (prepilin peptidase) / N-methyltransferase [Pseudonocardiales bacterium]
MAGVIPTAVWATLAGILGLAIGSFLNVVIYRVPVNESVVSPPSRCPSCGSAIHNRHNVPVLGWLVLRGKCFACKAPISPRYPVVEALTGLLFAAVAIRFLHLHQAEALPAYLYFAAIGIALTMIDIDHKRLPNKIVLPSYIVIGVLLTIASIASHDWWALARAGIGAAALFAGFFALAFAYPAGMGFGDVKLAGVLGGVLAYLSWSTLAVGAFGGFLLGAVGGVVLMAVGRGNRKTAIPFGPYLIVGALVAIFAAHPIADAYLRMVGRN